jgi:hypothetical protein
MNPMSLLTKGRTIRGFKKHSNAYSLANMGVAPNFSAGRNKTPTVPHPVAPVSQPTFFDKPQQPASAPAMRPPAVAREPGWPKNGWVRLSAFCSALLQRCRAPRKASPFEGSTVQTELALVKVMRNDLSDDDLELVPVAKKEKPDEHEQCQAIPTDR